jgi:S1-C subfamily serine protease
VLLAAAPPAGAAGPTDSVVKVIASLSYPNPLQPWSKGKAVEVTGTGVVIEGRRILTNAHLVMSATEVHVQPRPGGDKVEAQVAGLGTDVDLAVLTVKEEKFFEKRPALARARQLPRMQDGVAVHGFPVGGTELSVTRGVVSRIDHGILYGLTPGKLIQVSAAINPGNSGGPAVVDNKMIGVVCSRLNEAEGIGYVIPNEEIGGFLARLKGGRYEPKPMEATGTDFQRLENPALRGLLKLADKTRGLLVRPPARRGADYPLREFDVLTRIGPFDVNDDGMVRLEDDSRVPFLTVLPRVARGGAVPLTVLREGKEVAVSLPVTTRDNRLIRDYEGEKPSYFIHGPLVFSPTKGDALPLYFRLNPALYDSNSPLITRRYDRVQFPGEELVVVTRPMFDHKIARGYGDPVGRVVAQVNGVRIKNLVHLVQTIRDSTDTYLTFRFADEGAEFLVFDRKELASAGVDGTVKLWDTDTGGEKAALRLDRYGAQSVAYSPDGKSLVATLGFFTPVRIWNLATPAETLTLTGHRSWVSRAVFAPDGKRLATASADGSVKLWDAGTGREQRTLTGHTSGVAWIAFSPDGTHLASASWDKTIKVWNTTSGVEEVTLKGHTAEVRSVAFSPDGERLISGSRDHTVRVWDWKNGREIDSSQGHTDSVNGVSFSPDGQELASAGDDRCVRVWKVAPRQGKEDASKR